MVIDLLHLFSATQARKAGSPFLPSHHQSAWLLVDGIYVLRTTVGAALSEWFLVLPPPLAVALFLKVYKMTYVHPWFLLCNTTCNNFDMTKYIRTTFYIPVVHDAQYISLVTVK